MPFRRRATYDLSCMNESDRLVSFAEQSINYKKVKLIDHIKQRKSRSQSVLSENMPNFII